MCRSSAAMSAMMIGLVIASAGCNKKPDAPVVVEPASKPAPAQPNASKSADVALPFGALVFEHSLSTPDTLDKFYRADGAYGGQPTLILGNGVKLGGGHAPPMLWAKPFLGEKYRVQFEVQLNEPGWSGWTLNGPGYGNSSRAGYWCRLDKAAFQLWREDAQVQSDKLAKEITPGEWAKVQVDFDRGKIAVTIDGAPASSFTDATPLTGTLHGWFGMNGGDTIYRNLRIWSTTAAADQERRLTPPATEKPVPNGALLHELKLAGGDLGPEWAKSQPANTSVTNQTLILSGQGNGTPLVLLTKALSSQIACEVEFEYPTDEAVNFHVYLWLAKKTPQSAKDCDVGWSVALPANDGRTLVSWHGGPKDAGAGWDSRAQLVAGTGYYAAIPNRKYLARIENHRDQLRVLRDGGLILTAKRPASTASADTPVFLALRQYFGGVKVHSVRVYQLAADRKTEP